jgi:hypothetical protein
MTAVSDLDRSLETWLDAEAQVATPPDLLDAVIALTARRVPRRRVVASLRMTTGAAAWPRRSAPPRRMSIRLVILGLLVLALMTAAVATSGLVRPSVPPLPTSVALKPSIAIPSSVVPAAATAGPLFQEAGRLVNERPGIPTVTRLNDGRVAITGGGPREVEIWDPKTQLSFTAGELTVSRTDHLAVSLDDGRLLLIGGFDTTDLDQQRLTTAEIYDPATGTSVETGSMSSSHAPCHCGIPFVDMVMPAALRLLDGRVMVVGGQASTDENGSVADIWAPATGTFEQVPVGCDASRGAQAVLRDGRVLVTCFAGGPIDTISPAPGVNRAAIFDPATDRFTETGSPTTTDTGTLTVLPDGRALLAGDAYRTAVGSAELYDPAAGTFTPLPGSPATVHEVLALADGRYLFAGTFTGVDDERWVFDPTDLSFRRLPDTVGFRMATGVPVVLLDGRVVIVTKRDLTLMDANHLPGEAP